MTKTNPFAPDPWNQSRRFPQHYFRNTKVVLGPLQLLGLKGLVLIIKQNLRIMR